MSKYLIFSDLDGTLADLDHDVNDHTKEVIRKTLDAGHEFYIATGRMMSLVADVAYSIDPRVKIVASNGGIIQEEDAFQKNVMDKEIIPLIYDIAMKYDLPTLFFTDKDILFTHFIPEFFMMTNGYHHRTKTTPVFKKIENIHEDIKNFDIINALATIRDVNDTEISTNEKDLERLAIAREEMRSIDNLSVAASAPDNMELYPTSTSKGNALKRIMERLQAENTLVFGDGYNDVSMFNVADKSVAMANAPRGVKEHASHETLSNKDNGVAHFLIHNILK
jgi:Cof subfamily protein (haloacid dehalogenase superfamily)